MCGYNEADLRTSNSTLCILNLSYPSLRSSLRSSQHLSIPAASNTISLTVTNPSGLDLYATLDRNPTTVKRLPYGSKVELERFENFKDSEVR